MVGRALGHLVASGTATIGMGCARLKPQRRGAKRPRYGGKFGGCLAIGIVPGNRRTSPRNRVVAGEPANVSLLADAIHLMPRGGPRARLLIGDKAEFAEAMEGPKRWRADHPRLPIQ